jgi:hypothetical protein
MMNSLRKIAFAALLAGLGTSPVFAEEACGAKSAGPADVPLSECSASSALPGEPLLESEGERLDPWGRTGMDRKIRRMIL